MKVLETHFSGYRFRSHLEARWAVYLEHLQVPYSYEPEGYNLRPTFTQALAGPTESLGALAWVRAFEGELSPADLCYLPDFWLPTLLAPGSATPGAFLEIKPCVRWVRGLVATPNARCALLSLLTGAPVLLAIGHPLTPAEGMGILDDAFPYDNPAGNICTFHANVARIFVRFATCSHCRGVAIARGGLCELSEGCDGTFFEDTEALHLAALAARAARFEHGETPQPLSSTGARAVPQWRNT